MNISISDGIEIATVGLGVVTLVAGSLHRWAVANHRDRLAMLTSAAGNAAGRINAALRELPVGADVKAEKAILLGAASTALVSEFASTAKAIGATPDKAAAMIAGQIGPVVAVVAPQVVAAVEAATPAVVAAVEAEIAHAV